MNEMAKVLIYHSRSTQKLRNMRLVCKRFGYDKPLNQALFHGISLICDAQSYNRIANADISLFDTLISFLRCMLVLHHEALGNWSLLQPKISLDATAMNRAGQTREL